MIVYRCVCGQLLQVGDDLANCQARCPKCRAVSVVPPSASFSGHVLPITDVDPTVSSKHDRTIKPPETPPPKKKEPGA
jgi:hypothetical protein